MIPEMMKSRILSCRKMWRCENIVMKVRYQISQHISWNLNKIIANVYYPHRFTTPLNPSLIPSPYLPLFKPPILSLTLIRILSLTFTLSPSLTQPSLSPSKPHLPFLSQPPLTPLNQHSSPFLPSIFLPSPILSPFPQTSPPGPPAGWQAKNSY